MTPELIVDTVKEIPGSHRRGKRSSACWDVLKKAKESAPEIVRVQAEEPEDLTRFYKSMIQFRARHVDEFTLRLQKAGDVLYVWVEEKDTEAAQKVLKRKP